jgi:hypothetical protein
MSRPPLLALTAILALTVAAPAEARTLHGAGGFRVSAPRDFSISHNAATGVYRIASRRRHARVSYLLLSGAGSAQDVVTNFVAQSKGKAFGPGSGGASRYRQTATIGGRREIVEARAAGAGLALTVRGSTRGTGRRIAATASSLDATLAAISRRAAGGTAVPVPTRTVQIPVQPAPLRTFTTVDGSASGQVPADPSFACSGTNGAVECYSAKGEATLGIAATICPPGSLSAAYGICPVVAPFTNDAAAAFQAVWPRVRNLAPQNGTVGAEQVLVSQPVSVPGYTSAAMLYSHFTLNGTPWTGAFLVALTPGTGADYWLMYVSGISIPDSDDSSYGQALVKTWSSWDSTNAIDGRLAQIDADADATAGIVQSVNDFRQAVHTEANEAWDAYVRM